MNTFNDDFDYLFKVVIIGDSNVGKTNILSRYNRNEFTVNSKSTIGVEFMNKYVDFDNNVIKLQLWDTAGQERYRAITSAYYRGAHGIIMVYDITLYKSYENIKKIWIPQIKDNLAFNIPIILVGNKNDLDYSRQINSEEAKKFAEENNILFIETSSKENIGIKDIFIQLIEKMYKNRNNNTINSNIVLKSNMPLIAKPSSKCC
jgi:Ras-related protein Rab-11A